MTFLFWFSINSILIQELVHNFLGISFAYINFMKNIIIVSKCQRAINLNMEEQTYDFHFKGVFLGKNLKLINLKCSVDHQLIKGEEYILYVKVERVDSGILYGRILKHKCLKNCWDKS